MAEPNRSNLNLLLSNLYENTNLITKLEVYADKLLKKSTKNSFARHFCPSDIVSSITLKLFSGEINWDPQSSTLTSFYFSRISTEIFNLTRKEMKFIPAGLGNSETEDDYTGESEDVSPDFPQLIIFPFDEEDNEKEKYDPDEIRKVAYEIFKDSTEEFLVLDDIYKGLHTREIALDLGITKDDVHNIKRRINRVIKAWAKRNQAEKNNSQILRFTDNDKPLTDSLLENNPGESTPDNNNNGELI
jgi:DNA-directed RNA polymerase specialized sigma24 family protein